MGKNSPSDDHLHASLLRNVRHVVTARVILCTIYYSIALQLILSIWLLFDLSNLLYVNPPEIIHVAGGGV